MREVTLAAKEAVTLIINMYQRICEGFIGSEVHWSHAQFVFPARRLLLWCGEPRRGVGAVGGRYGAPALRARPGRLRRTTRPCAGRLRSALRPRPQAARARRSVPGHPH